MSSRMSELETKILAVLQEGLADSRTPFKDLAQRVGIGTDELLRMLQKWKDEGRLRRIGAVVNHIKLGFGVGAMVAWQVEAERIEEVGRILAGFDRVSHAYEREIAPNWPYNIYTMVHAVSAGELVDVIGRMSKACGIGDYRVLVTERELKKAPPRYVAK